MSTSYRDLILQEDLNRGVGTKDRRNPGGGSKTGTQISLSCFARNSAATVAAWNPGSIASGSFEAKNVTVAGAALTDHVMVSFSLDVQDMQLSGNVTATNTVTVLLQNLTGAAVDLGNGNLSVLVFAVR